MRERLRLEGELSDLGFRPSAHELATVTKPQVMFEFDVHYGFRDEIDRQLGQTVPGHVRLTKHRNDTEFFNVKRDLDRMEIGTARFPLDAVGLANLETAKANIKKFADALAKGCRHAKKRPDISLAGISGHPRLFALPQAKKKFAGVLVHKLHLNKKFPSNCVVWASPQAHLTIPLAKVGALIEAIERSAGRPSGLALTGAGRQRMGFKSDHLYRAKEGVDSLRAAMVTWKQKLSNGVPVDKTSFSDQLAGFLMLQVSYLWVSKLAQAKDTEFFGKGHLPINVKAPFRDIFTQVLTADEQLLYREFLAGPTIRYRLFGTVEDSPTLALGANNLFPPVVGSSMTWDDLLDETLGLKPSSGLPGGGKEWPVATTAPLVALELRRIGFEAMTANRWPKLMDTVVALSKRLNA